MGKIKSSLNNAVNVETKPQADINTMTGEELAELLDQQHSFLDQTKNNILIIRQVLQKRKRDKKDNG